MLELSDQSTGRFFGNCSLKIRYIVQTRSNAFLTYHLNGNHSSASGRFVLVQNDCKVFDVGYPRPHSGVLDESLHDNAEIVHPWLVPYLLLLETYPRACTCQAEQVIAQFWGNLPVQHCEPETLHHLQQSRLVKIPGVVDTWKRQDKEQKRKCFVCLVTWSRS
jgi:hypothetical protein